MSQTSDTSPSSPYQAGQRHALRSWPKRPLAGFAIAFERLRRTAKLRARAHEALNNNRPAEAVRLLRILARRHDPEALFLLGRSYAQGSGVIRNMPEAVVWMRKAADLGNADAQHFLGQVYSNGLGGVRDFCDPMRLYGRAGNGHKAADGRKPTNSSLLFPAGMDIQKNEAEAVLWLERAARSGQIYAQLDLGQRCLSGQGVEQDIERGLKLLQDSAKGGCSKAHLALARQFLAVDGKVGHNPAMALDHLRAAARLGNAEAAGEAGVMLSSGGEVPIDLVEAAAWYQQAASRNHVPSQINLANLYLRGQGVAQNFHKAAELYRKAAHKSSNPIAQWRLGTLFEVGRGVEKDAFEASEWYRKAADQGFARAQFCLGALYLRGQGVTRNDPLAAEWFQKAAAGGVFQANINLAVMHAKGRLGPKNIAAAREWLNRCRPGSTPEEAAQIRQIETLLG
jgi:TPR repeat protein